MKRKKLRLTPKQAEHMLFNVLEIGSRMLVSGAEVQRVENSIYRMCTAYGSETTEVFCMTYMIVVTISSKQFGTITLSRRIHNLSLNLYELLYLNALSRRMCSTLPVFSRASGFCEAAPEGRSVLLPCGVLRRKHTTHFRFPRRQ